MRHIANFLRAITLVFAGALGVAVVAPAVSQGFIGIFQNGLATSPSGYGVGDSTSGFYFGTNRVGVAGHLESGLKTSLGQPALTSCGTTPALTTNSTDTAGTITMGTSATGCVVTFGTAFAAAPACMVTWRATPLMSQSYTTSTTALTLTQTSTSNNLVDYLCVARSGG